MTRSNNDNHGATVGIESRDVCNARDSIQAALSPYLGTNLALERANNIAQALITGSGNVREIASEMLRNAGVEDVDQLTSRVVSAWYLAMSHH